MKNKIILSFVLLFLFTELYSQTGGPGQPEFMQFQQAGTENLVNPATGTFSYQIPLFTIGGYPMNLAYQSGIQMEDVASMVGLGWNLNAGSIVRTLRGLPDDFNGDDIIIKEFSFRENITYGGKIGGDLEIAGMGQYLGLSEGGDMGVFYNNYKGWGLEYSLRGSLSAGYMSNKGVGGKASLGMGVAVNSQSGVDKYISPSVGLKMGNDKNALAVSLGKTWSVNSNEGQKSSLNTGLSYVRYSETTRKGIVNGEKTDKKASTDASSISLLGYSNQSYLNNSFQPDIDYPFVNTSGTFSGAFGWDAYYVDPSLRITGYFSKQKLSTKIQFFRAIGTMYENEDNIYGETLMDFNREKKLPYYAGESKILPVPYKTPDVFNLNAQGLSMTFSVSKNDIGMVGDAQAIINSTGTQEGAEADIGNLFKAGLNVGTTNSFQTSGRWKDATIIRFKPEQGVNNGNLYQQFCFKNHGEINEFQDSAFIKMGRYNPFTFGVINAKTVTSPFSSNDESINKIQQVRQSTINYLTAAEASNIGFDKKINYYEFGSNTAMQAMDRIGGDRKPQHLSEISVTQPDGMKYIFGIPVYNTTQKEVTFNVEGSEVDSINNLVKYNAGIDNSTGNTKGTDYFFESTTTPAYATQFLITAVLSPDYRDITNNGISDDDLGNYVKFNYYFNKDTLYNWRTPYEEDRATYNKALRSDDNDDKGSYVYGEKELWYIRSIESKTEIAKFYYSERKDALGVNGENGGKNLSNYLQKLDSIKVYSKPDLNANITNATPVKTIYFNYDYSLCKKINNGINSDSGKLTLTEVAMTYENSRKGKLTPYRFEYGKTPGNTIDPDYNVRDVNRWGYFQKNHTNAYSDYNNNSALSNIDFPYASQNKSEMDKNAYAWNLTDITLPGSGKIKIDYEAHDYAYIQDKTAGQMFMVSGIDTVGQNIFYKNNFPLLPLYSHYYKIFFQLSEHVNNKEELEDKYIKDIKNDYLYYKFYVKLRDGNTFFNNNHGYYEYITGYAKVKDFGLANNNNYAWIELEPADIDDDKPDNGTCNPILKTALQFMRINRNKLLFDIFPDEAPNEITDFALELPSVLGQLVGQIAAQTMGVNKYCTTLNFCKEVVLEKSFIRLYNPAKSKLAGGSRVKQININDNWSAMAGNDHESKSYTTDYYYTTEEVSPVTKDTLIISSGVADYEPMIGGDEISLKKPIFYSDIRKKAPDNDYYVEEPVNESLFPAPQITYSKVTQVTNKTDLNVGKTGKIVNEYFTSKDFPVKVKMTVVSEERDKTTYNSFQLPFFAIDQQHDFATVTQGYSIELNNMSGLPKATWVYNENGDRISGEETKYFPNNDSITTIDGEGKIHRNTQMGLSVEYTIDSRKSYDKSETEIEQKNLNVSAFGLIFIPLFVPLYSDMTEEKQFQSVVTNKVIHRNALLKSKTVYSQTASVTTENLAFDKVTGEALLTKTTNEFNDTLFSFKYPAYWMYYGMGPSYVNTKMKVNTSNIGSVKQFLKVGDELRGDNGTRLWVLNNTPPSTPVFVGVDKNPTFPFPADGDFQVYNSGAKNLLSASAGQVVTWNYNPLSNVNKINFNFHNTQRVLNSSSIEYFDDAVMYCDSCRILLTRYGKNDFLSGIKGNWKPKKTWFYLTERTSGDTSSGVTNIRKQGLFIKYNDFWRLPVTPSKNWTINSTNWEWKEKVNMVDADGLTIETEDRIGRKVASLLGYDNTLVKAQTYNAAYNETFFDGFEDYFISYCPKIKLSPYAEINKMESHTGKYSLKVSDYFTFTVMPPTICKPNTNNRFSSSTGCNDCIGGFLPLKNKKYVFSCWVKVDKTQPILSCSDASVVISFGATTLATLNSQGPVIEDWQRIEGTFSTLLDSNISIKLKKGTATTYFDDIRIFPADANMVSYIYDDLNLRHTFTLDENNYFTKYEYNNQGDLIRIKKETEKGIITLKESNQALIKIP